MYRNSKWHCRAAPSGAQPLKRPEGIPAYLGQFDDRAPLLINIERHILEVGSYLYVELQYLLREELRAPRNYCAILQAIAQGVYRLRDDFLRFWFRFVFTHVSLLESGYTAPVL